MKSAIQCVAGSTTSGTLDVQLRAVLEESVCVILRYLHNRLMLTLCALQHLVIARVTVACQMSYIGNVHYTLYIVTDIAQVLFKHILHNVAAQIPMCAKWYTVGPQVYIFTLPSTFGTNSSFLCDSELYNCIFLSSLLFNIVFFKFFS